MGAIPEKRAYKRRPEWRRGDTSREPEETPALKQQLISGSSSGITQHDRMDLRLLQLCLLLSACAFSSVLSCRWIKHKFRQHHGVSLDLIRKMGEKIHNDHEDVNPIPDELINNHRSAEPEKRILFVIQALMEITVLFDDAVVPWEAKKLKDFLDVMHEQIKGLRSCVSTLRVEI
ncbi:interferon a3-like [Cyprinus carpio]|uniref:Interferon a3-like n=1 Tax=Cyprinus carpio TaxID=7962 RepID=A0A9Q9YQZ8_CYPCA|nr:interferon a3-like [Cyprinus carpio]